MKRKSIYKQIALSLLLLVCAAGNNLAWGQETGDKYLKPQTYLDLTGATFVADISAEADHEIKNAFDNIDETYWKASSGIGATVTIDFGKEVTIQGMSIWRSGNPQERAKTIKISTSETEDGTYTEHYTETFIHQGTSGNDRYTFTFSDIKTQYLKLEFTTHGSVSAFNEIDFITPIEDPDKLTIQHKYAKWYYLRQGSNYEDDFDEKNEMFDTSADWRPGIAHTSIQATHTYIDTIYAHRGSTVQLTLPDYLKEDISIQSYQRWYSFRTGRTFATQYNNDESGNEEERIVDLLTPTVDNFYYRFTNGYVGSPLSPLPKDQGSICSMNFYIPKDNEFNDMFPNADKTIIDNNWYVVACDVSGYTDYTNEFDEEKSKNATFGANEVYYEPTLSHRIVFYIHAVEDEDSWYHKNWDDTNNPYLEEYEINMPFTRLPDKADGKLIYEMVALSKDARSYVSSTGKKDENVNLEVDLGKNTAGIDLKTTSLSGTNRVISFDYPEDDDTGTKHVKEPEDGSTPMAEIIVKNGKKNIARFVLKFTKGTSLMTQSMIDQINKKTEETVDNDWNIYTERTPQYMEENYEFLTGLDFNFKGPEARQGVYYPYPLAWDHCSYAFFDGSTGDYFEGGTFPQWGYYSIMNNYLECAGSGDAWGWTGGHTQAEKPTETCMEPRVEGEESLYHMFIDASDRPGIIARLPFEKELCPGSELFVSAWVKSAKWNEQTTNAAMLFTFMGVTEDGKYVPLYRHQTGQIPATYMDEGIKLPGFDTGSNEWFQLAFSFVTDQDIATEYRSFVLQIENNSASTSGGDMYLDDVRVYLKNVEAEVKQLESTCSDARTRLNFSIDWEQLTSRRGEVDLSDEDLKNYPTKAAEHFSGIGLCFIDKWKYEETQKLDESVVYIGANDGDGINNYQYAAMCYKLDYEANTEYSTGQKQEDGALAKNNNWFFYREGTDNDRKLIVDFFADIRPYRPYIMMVVPLPDELLQASIEQDGINYIREQLKNEPYKSLFGAINDDCAIQTEVYVNSQSLITVDGEILNPGDEYCEGQIRNFAVQLQAPTGEGGALKPVEETVYFDWFFGTEDEFITDDRDFGVSLAEALQELRNLENNGTDIETIEAVKAVLPTEDGFTENMKKLILREMETTEEGQNARLVLHKKNLNIQLLESLNLVVRPIQIKLTTVDEETVNICWEYIPLELKTTGKSPVAHVGFHDVTYPAEPNIRIGLAQIEGAKDKDTALKINLRGVDLIEDNGELSLNEENKYVYLVGTNDPGIDLDGYTDLDLPIGTLHEIEATETESADNYIRISFDLEGNQTTEENNSFQFDPKEGYEYQLKIYFQEQVDNKQVTSLCDGNLVFTMKVVPEYQFWIGGATGNWNNDNNWVRANAKDMNNPTGYIDYTSEHKGYVPMRFTNVVIPTEYNQVELYGYTTTNHIVDISTNKPMTTEGSTQYIEYDLMVKSATESSSGYAYDCEPYYSNTVNQIHFEPNAEMLHAEYLQYDTAWVEYELEKNQWHTLASPLQAVVSGDWYTAKSGRQETEYFKDIKFEGSNYSRLDPKVYQRGWGQDAKMVETTTGDNNTVAVSGNWSGVYNNVNESFTPGSGFSVKVIGGEASGTSTADNDKALFRFPKSDEKYNYQSNDNGNPSNETNIERSNGKSGKLQSDGLTSEEASFTVKLHAANGTSAYYLVGNPFMTALNMTAFFEKNTNLENKYWYITDDKQNIAAGDITTSSATSVPALQSFFVQKSGTTNSVTDAETVTFTAEMQTLSSETTGETTNSNAMLLTATTADGRQSRAAIAYDGSASAGYEADEDAELFLDSNLSDVPAVYTVAGTMATSINRTSELWNIPVGVYGDDNETVTLSFSGLNGFSGAMFYDAEKKVETPLYEGKEIAVSANTGGRYFIRATAMPTANEPVIAHKSILIYSLGNGKALVTSEGNPLSTVSVYNMNGALIRQEKCSGNQHELHLPKGVYLIVASDSEGLQENGKVLLR